MKILLAPAETKKVGGNSTTYSKNNFYFKEIFSIRDNVVQTYEAFIQNSSIDELSKWFGLKNLKECTKYSQSLLTLPTTKAIQRYTGVAFDALDYNSLSFNQQKYCDENIVLFSNLFGVLKANDLIPDYKYKQGAILPDLDVINYYKNNIKDTLDKYLGEEVVDLRAGFYDKFYIPTASTITFKFLKNSKVVSHWAKHYRGLVIRAIAQNDINNFTELMNMSIDGLKLIEIQEKKNRKTLIMQITK